MTDSDAPPSPPTASSSSTSPRTRSRRFLLAATGGLSIAATTGCLSESATDGETPETVPRPTVFVFNTGDGTVSLVDVETDAVVGTVAIGMTSSFPSNQFTPQLADTAAAPLWCNVDEGVRALSAGALEETVAVETGSGANWQERTPDGTHLVVSAREPVHGQVRIDADPASESFGDVTGEIDRRAEGGRDDHEGPGPCDVTIHPDGEYAYVPDLYGDTLTVVDVEDFEIARQIDVEPGGPAGGDGSGEPSTAEVSPAPYMGTAAWDGDTLLVENDGGSESIWDVSNPARPVEVTRLTTDDGLGVGPLTSEIGPDSRWGYVFTPGTEDVTVVDIAAQTIETRLDLGGAAFAGSWDPAREKLYAAVQTADEVAVIDATSRTVTTTIEVGPAPYGATAARTRPAEIDASATPRREGRIGTYDTTYCRGECACGHEL